MKTYLNNVHLLTDEEIRNSEMVMNWDFKCNDDYYNYKKAKFAFYEIRCGSVSVLEDGISFKESIDNNILINNARLSPNIKIEDYIILKQINNDGLIGNDNNLDDNYKTDIKLIGSILSEKTLEFSDKYDKLYSIVEEYNNELKQNSIYYRINKLQNMDVQLLKENSLLNMLENKEINDKRINNIINSNIIDCEYEVKELYKLNTDNKRKLLINKHKKQLQRSPFNRNTNNKILKPILKKKLIIKYGDISKPLNITNRELDMNLQLSRINRNNNQCQSLVKVSTSSAFGKRLINRKNDKRTFSITSPLLNAVRRSSRLA
jgi:hypothetical protein